MTMTEGELERPRLLNASSYHLTRFVAPVYPPLAKQARVQGNVQLELGVDPETGNVTSVAIYFRPSPLDGGDTGCGEAVAL